MTTDLKFWIDRLIQPRNELGGFSVCPYAKGINYEIVETDGSNIDPPPWDFELIIYKLPDKYSEDEIIEIAREYSKIYPSLIFLPDPKDRYTEINGIQTNNGKFNLILCQYRDNLDKARNRLKNTNYYSFWDPKYLDEILSS
jgi:RNA recognition motif-containing protein